MKWTFSILIFVFSLQPIANADAAGFECSDTGYTVVTINGVFVNEREAQDNKDTLKQILNKNYKGEKIFTDYLHNPSHLAGLGDLIKVVEQGLLDDETLRDYDLVEMLRDASEKVQTRKLLLVAHSQGNFYANGFYDAVAGKEGGVPTESIGVYGVATPASRVAGGGKWLTSDTDRVIAGLVGRTLARPILKPNAHIELKESDGLGHNFSDIYLTYRAAEIVSDIESSLAELRASGAQDETTPCIAPPKLTLGHRAAGIAFIVADPTANAVLATAVGAARGVAAVGGAIASAAQFVAEKIASVFEKEAGQAAAVAVSQPATEDPQQTTEKNSPPPARASAVSESIGTNAAPPPASESQKEAEEEARGNQTIAAEVQNETSSAPPPPPEPTRLAPQGGGGGGVTNPPRPQTNTAEVAPPETESPPSTADQDTAAPNAPVITNPPSGAAFTTTSIAFTGTAEASSTISSDFSGATTTAGLDGVWSLTLNLPQEATTISFFATDAAGNRSAPAAATVTVDSLAPSLTLSDATECAETLVAGSCLIATTTLSWSWSSGASDIAYFAIDENGSFATTTATSTRVQAADQSTYSFSAAAVDALGNASATTTKTASVFRMPVVINEVAWAGTAASAADEWIELYNNTGETVSLEKFILYANDLSPYLPLSGSMTPHSYYLIERKNTGETDEATESAITDIAANLWTSFGEGLNNNGENLTLAYRGSGATTTIDLAPVCGGGWCGGESVSRKTMERYDSNGSGAESSNWQSHLGEFIQNGRDTGGASLHGTPKRRNSVSHRIVPSGGTLSANKILAAANSPYLVDRSGLTVAAGATLTIEPNVVVKIVSANEPWIRVLGTMLSEGTAESPVVFTSFYDDLYGGDLNNDGASTTPAAGNWRRIFFETESTGSSITHTLVRYGGNNNISDPPAKKGAVGVEGATVTFNHLAVEQSGYHGLALANSASTVTNSRFSTSTNAAVSASGLFVSGGSPAVSASVFSGNRRGATIESSAASFSENTFVQNAAEAVYATGALGSFHANAGTGNDVNAIVIAAGSAITQAGATTTLSANPTLPYVVKGSATVAENSTLSFESGTVVKGYDSRGGSYGEIIVSSGAALRAALASPTDLVFTSIKDSTVGGTTENGIGAATAGDWSGITVNAGGIIDLSGFTLRYGGHKADTGWPVMGENAGALKITGFGGSSGRLSQALFEHNYQSGLNLADVSDFSVSGATFRNHTLKRLGSAVGIYAAHSTSTLSDIVFSGNEKDTVGAGGNALTCANCGTPTTAPPNLFSP